MSTLIETEVATRTRRPARPAPEPEMAGPEPNASAEAILCPCPRDHPEFKAAVKRLERLTADRLDAEQRLAAAEARAATHGPVAGIVGDRARALFNGSPFDWQPAEPLVRVREDLLVAKAAEGMARQHRDELVRSISRQVSEETRPRYNDLCRASYIALLILVECEERIDAFLGGLTAGGVRDAHRRCPPMLLGAPISRATILNHFDNLMLDGPANCLTGTVYQDRPNAPNPTDD